MLAIEDIQLKIVGSFPGRYTADEDLKGFRNWFLPINKTL